MTARRHRLAGHGLERGPEVTVVVDGRPRTAYHGESVAAALMADDDDLEVRTTSGGAPRGLFCGMGACFDCLVVVDGIPGTRACVAWVRDGMVVDRQQGRGIPYRPTGRRSGASTGDDS